MMYVEIIPFAETSETLFTELCESMPEEECRWLHKEDPIACLRGLRANKKA
jgi:hypothetical protein